MGEKLLFPIDRSERLLEKVALGLASQQAKVEGQVLFQKRVDLIVSRLAVATVAIPVEWD